MKIEITEVQFNEKDQILQEEVIAGFGTGSCGATSGGCESPLQGHVESVEL